MGNFPSVRQNLKWFVLLHLVDLHGRKLYSRDMKASILRALYEGRAAYPANLISFSLFYPSVALAGALAVVPRPPSEWMPPNIWARVLVEVAHYLRPRVRFSAIRFGYASDAIEPVILGYALYNAVYRGGAFPIKDLKVGKRVVEDGVRYAAYISAHLTGRVVGDSLCLKEVGDGKESGLEGNKRGFEQAV